MLKEFLLLFASKTAEMQHPISVGKNGYTEALRCIRAAKITEAKTDFTKTVFRQLYSHVKKIISITHTILTNKLVSESEI